MYMCVWKQICLYVYVYAHWFMHAKCQYFVQFYVTYEQLKSKFTTMYRPTLYNFLFFDYTS
jgi:hypothetical protein